MNPTAAVVSANGLATGLVIDEPGRSDHVRLMDVAWRLIVLVAVLAFVFRRQARRLLNRLTQ